MNPELWAIAKTVLTPLQYEILVLRERHGMSNYQIALAKNRSISTIRSHLRAIDHNLGRALKEDQHKGGSPSPTERGAMTIRTQADL